MKTFWIASLLFICSTGVWGQCTITVMVKNVKQRSGELRVAICVSPKEFMTELYREEIIKVPAKGGDIMVQFKNVPKGIYAVRSYQDVNTSKKLESNFLGMPEEPVGFSNNPDMPLGPPKFEDASFTVNKDILVKVALQVIEFF